MRNRKYISRTVENENDNLNAYKNDESMLRLTFRSAPEFTNVVKLDLDGDTYFSSSFYVVLCSILFFNVFIFFSLKWRINAFCNNLIAMLTYTRQQTISLTSSAVFAINSFVGEDDAHHEDNYDLKRLVPLRFKHFFLTNLTSKIMLVMLSEKIAELT